MRERPILFSGEMVRAILAGRKTQTRRVLKPQPEPDCPLGLVAMCRRETQRGPDWFSSTGPPNSPWRHHKETSWRCPYGQPGERLWVRETFVVGHPAEGSEIRTDLPEKVWYRATDGIEWVGENGEDVNVPWKPSIHMPRWASRLTLEVTDVRVERIQNISEEDARAEGITDKIIEAISPRPLFRPGFGRPLTPVAAFAALWDSINTKRGYSWESNPWVWVVSFRTATPDRPHQGQNDGLDDKPPGLTDR